MRNIRNAAVLGALVACLFMLPTVATADLMAIDDFTVGNFTATTNDNPDGRGISWMQDLPKQHVLSGERKAAVSRLSPSGTGVSTMSVANGVLRVDTTQANFTTSLGLSYGSRSGPGTEMFLPYAMNSDWDAAGVEAIMIDIAEFTSTSPMRLWVFLHSGARPHPQISGWVVSESAEVILDISPAPGGVQIVLPRSQFTNLNALPLDWSSIDGIDIGTLNPGNLVAGSRLVINGIYGIIPEPAFAGLAAGLGCLLLRRRSMDA